MSEFETLRSEAQSGTTLELSKRLLEHFPRLVAHRGTSGLTDLHYQDFDLGGAVCCTAAEATLLAKLAELSIPLDALEIGSYVGWSAAHIAQWCSLTCVDPMTEVECDSVFPLIRFWENVDRCGLRRKVRIIKQPSPDVIPMIAPPTRGFDFVFVDGKHTDRQPERDVRGLLPHLAKDAVVILHDLWIRDVKEAANVLVQAGFKLNVLPTANYLTVFWRDMPKWWPDFMKLALFDQALCLDEAVKRSTEKVFLELFRD